MTEYRGGLVADEVDEDGLSFVPRRRGELPRQFPGAVRLPLGRRHESPQDGRQQSVAGLNRQPCPAEPHPGHDRPSSTDRQIEQLQPVVVAERVQAQPFQPRQPRLPSPLVMPESCRHGPHATDTAGRPLPTRRRARASRKLLAAT